MNSSNQNNYLVQPTQALNGRMTVPGDKSISHRALMLGAIAEGETRIRGFLQGEDTLATARAFQQMGVDIQNAGEQVIVKGVGLNGLKQANKPLDLGNSGTSVRLMTGLLSGQVFDSELIGDESLMIRPMGRIIDPLREMNASIECTDKGILPIKIRGGAQLKGIEYSMPVASAQLKSCLVLAGLYAEGTTSILENEATRDHTERMLTTFSHPLTVTNKKISITRAEKLVATNINVPGDFSSSAFFIVAASIVPDSDIVLENIGINPTRSAMLNIMKLMGADIELQNEREQSGEPVADIHVRSAELSGIHIPEKYVPIAIDEFPVILIAAACANGTTCLSGAAELRVKESDRIQAMLNGLIALGVDATAEPDGMIVNGGEISGGEINSYGDHRIAMAFAVAANVATGPVKIKDCKNVATSFPGFVELAKKIRMKIDYVS